MHKLKYIIIGAFFLSVYSCTGLVEGINDNPNEISSDNFDAGVLLMKGIDLANIYTCSFIATDDLGRQHLEGFEVLGRLEQADIRGCNLLVQ